MNPDLWLRVFCSYTKNYSAIEEWLSEVEGLGIEDASRIAGEFVETTGAAPDALTLGFSPQVLIAALALKPRLVVVTSPEVLEGRGPAFLSHKALSLIKDKNIKVYVAPFAPSELIGPDQVIKELTNLFRKLRKEGVEVIDISGGTQLVPIAIIRAGFNILTYAYPSGKKLVFYELRI